MSRVRTLAFTLLLVLAVAPTAFASWDDTSLGSCPADLTGSVEDLPDGVVDVFDLLFLLSTWGDTAPPRPRADIAPPDGRGDDEVNVGDLLELLANWGMCFPSYHFCANAIHPDNPEAKITGDGTIPFEINGYLDGPSRPSTNDINLIFNGPTTCGWMNYGTNVIPGNFQYGDIFGINVLSGIETGDVWFHYTASCSGRATFSIAGDGGPSEIFDSLMDIYPGEFCPTDWTQLLTCDDDSGFNFQSEASINALQGETFLIRIGSWADFEPDSTGILTYTCVDNSIFENALPLEIGNETTGSTINAQLSNAPICDGVETLASGRWYSVIGDGTTLTASTCGSELLFDTRLSVYCSFDESEANLSCISAANADTCDLDESVTWCSIDGRTYYVFVHGSSDLLPPFLSQGEFMLQINSDSYDCSTGSACDLP
ncbi:MAG: hypothetical protein O7G85_10455 [Planctomycetota bacterium]|nr:hypothetical protein [Planctomycetota bacterium]